MSAFEVLREALRAEHARQLELAPQAERPILALDQARDRAALRRVLDLPTDDARVLEQAIEALIVEYCS